MRYGFIGLLMLVFAAGAQAQDAPPMPTPNDDLTISPISFSQVVTDTITEGAIYDWWQISLNADDVIAVEMQAFQGLSPLIGILDPQQELVSRSDDNRPPEPDALAALQYRTETSGLFTIVATREGNQNGTTTGAYQLRVLKVNAIPERENELPPVEFRCTDQVATNALMVNFQDESRTVVNTGDFREKYRLTVYGQGDFAPLILAESDLVKTGRLDCNSDASAVLGNTYIIPGEDPVTLNEAGQAHAAQMTLQNSSLSDTFGEVRMTIGSLEGGRGRYIAVLEGLELQDANDIDTFIIHLGPLAAETPVTVYVVGANPGRLDARLDVYTPDNALAADCDDAGRGECSVVPSFVDAGASFLEGDTPTIFGDRFDPGVTLPTGSTQALRLEVSSGSTGTDGVYTVFFVGELPANK